MLVIPHRFKKIGLHNLVVRRKFSDILLALGLKKVEKHCRIDMRPNALHESLIFRPHRVNAEESA
jgi:hypothetical protein